MYVVLAEDRDGALQAFGPFANRQQAEKFRLAVGGGLPWAHSATLPVRDPEQGLERPPSPF